MIIGVPREVKIGENRVSVVPAGVQQVGDGYTLNLQGVSVEAAAQSILADILKVPYTLDPTATGTITMATGQRNAAMLTEPPAAME